MIRNVTYKIIDTTKVFFVGILLILISSVGNAQTIKLSSLNPSIPTGNLTPGLANQIIYRAVIEVGPGGALGWGVNLTYLVFKVTGIFAISDINYSSGVNGYRLFINNTNNFSTATSASNPVVAYSSGSNVNLPANNPWLSPNSTYYLWITADISSTAIIGHTMTVSALTISDITFTGGTKSGTMYAGGTQTIGTATATIVLSSAAGTDAQTKCINTAISNITYNTTVATGIGTATGLPAGVTATWSSNMITVSGIPTVSGIFNYIVPITGGSGSATGTITVNPATVITTQPITTQIVCQHATATSLSVSATGTGTLTYQWYSNSSNSNTGGTSIGAATNATYNPPTSNVGIKYYYVIVSSGCNSVTSSISKVDVTTCNNYWKGEISTDWELAGNWTANYVPISGNNIEFATVANNSGSAAVNNLQLPVGNAKVIGNLTNASNKNLIIPANASLTINGVISGSSAVEDASKIQIKAAQDGTTPNGSLIFSQLNTEVYGSVEFYSKSSWNLSTDTNNKYKWQFFGPPVVAVQASKTFDGAYVRKKIETGTTINNHWEQLSNNSLLQKFIGYEICQENPTTYLIQGQLVNTDFSSGQLTQTPGAIYPGQHLFSNPYTAAIDIQQLVFGSDMEATAYLYNTGTYDQWDTNLDKLGTSSGQYIAVPQANAGYGGLPRQVPSMGTVMVNALTATANAYLNFSYSSVIMHNDLPMRSKSQVQQDSKSRVLTTIVVEGENSVDKMWLFYDDNFKAGFDNGYDGKKIISPTSNCQIYAVATDGNYQINSIADVDNTTIAFQSGVDSNYTLIFNHENLHERYATLYLFDSEQDKIVDITENGATYSFTASSNSRSMHRFKIFSNIKSVEDVNNTQIKYFIEDQNIRLKNFSSKTGKIQLYNIKGQLVSTSTIESLGLEQIPIEPYQIYLLKITIGEETTVNKLVVK